MSTDEDDICSSFQYDFHKDIALSCVFGAAFFIGLFMIFFGYRMFRVSLFIQAFSLVALGVYQSLVDASTLPMLVRIVIACASAFVVSILSAFLMPVGILVMCFAQSVFLTSLILYVVTAITQLKYFFIPPALALLLFVALLIPAFRWQKKVAVIYVTSFGAVLLMLSTDYFVSLSMLRRLAYQNILVQAPTHKPCWFSWMLLTLWPLMMLLGCLVQFTKTGKVYDHRAAKVGKHWIKKDSGRKQLLSSKTDVIAKAWIQTSSSTVKNNDDDDDDVFLCEEHSTPV